MYCPACREAGEPQGGLCTDCLNKQVPGEHMKTTNIFEYASKNKLTFLGSKGPLSDRQLWDLPLSSKTGAVNLNDIAIVLDEEIAAAGKNKRIASTKPSEDVLVKLAIVEHIMASKQADALAEKEAKKTAEKKRIITEQIDKMEVNELTDGKSLKELRKSLAKL